MNRILGKNANYWGLAAHRWTSSRGLSRPMHRRRLVEIFTSGMVHFSSAKVLSKVFEHCILEIFGDFLVTNNNQFGFKNTLDVQMLYILLDR